MGLIVTLTGASGAGKTTVAGNLLELMPTTRMVASYTTREPRPSDLSGEYCQVTDKEFQKMHNRREFIWSVDPHRARYGTTYESINKTLAGGSHGIMILVPSVLELLTKYLQSRHQAQNLISFFVFSEKKLLESRLIKRGESQTEAFNRVDDSRKWATEAMVSKTPYVWIYNNGSLNQLHAKIYSVVIPCIEAKIAAIQKGAL